MRDAGCDAALATAKLSKCRHAVGAALKKGRRIMALGMNQSKTHPLVRELNPDGMVDKLHAEMHAILRSPVNVKGMRLYVARPIASGLGLSRPCKLCWEMIRSAGIKEVIYTTPTGWVREFV